MAQREASVPCAPTGRWVVEAAESSEAHSSAAWCGRGKEKTSVSNKAEGEEVLEAVP